MFSWNYYYNYSFSQPRQMENRRDSCHMWGATSSLLARICCFSSNVAVDLLTTSLTSFLLINFGGTLYSCYCHVVPYFVVYERLHTVFHGICNVIEMFLLPSSYRYISTTILLNLVDASFICRSTPPKRCRKKWNENSWDLFRVNQSHFRWR